MADSDKRDSIWGWDTSVRGFLGLVVIVLGTGLLVNSRSTGTGPRRPVPRLVIDPNSAPASVLSALPRIGPSRASAIIAARQSQRFRSLEDFDRRVRGIGRVTATALKPHLRFD
jgi:competence protein ComEA